MEHLEAIAAALGKYGLDGMLVTSEPGEFYAVGFHGEGTALVTGEGAWYFTDPRYIEAAGQQIRGAAVALPDPGKGVRGMIADLAREHGVRRLGIEDEYLSLAQFRGWEKALEAELVPASALLAGLRAVKDAEELAAMTEAQRITDECFAEILNYLRPGVTEREVAARLTYLMAARGAQRNSFDPIVAAGPNGSKPHAVPGDDRLMPGQFVTMDFGCVYEGYCSDMTRTVAIGQPTDEMRRVYSTVLQAQLAGIAAAKGGVKGSLVHEAAARVIAEAGYGAYFGHGFGHSLGIEIHENPRFSPAWDREVPAGAVVSAEPGIYLPGQFGVRIEDVIVLTETGCTDLTQSPKDLIIL